MLFKKAAMFATLCLASAAHNRLYAVIGAAPSEVQSLIEAKDVRGVYDGLVLIAADREPLPGADLIGEFGGNSTRYSLLVHVATEQHSTPAQWKKAVLAAAASTTGVRVAHQALVNAVVVAGASESIAVPVNTELIPLLESPMQPVHPLSLGRQTLRRKLKEFKSGVPNPSIVRLISAIDSNKQLEFLDYLSNTIYTRNSYALTQGGQQAANYIEAQFKAFGFTTEQHTFRSDMTPNVIATLQGSEDPDQVVVVGAHYDSRGPTRDSPTNRAPGANDDGSGTALLLELARIIFESKMEFRFTLIIGAWSGEEQGLLGSRAYAQRCKQRGMNIIAMLQSDMVAYRRPGENIQCAFPTRFADQVLTDLAMLVMGEYVPDMQTCYTTACCSDHQSFTEQGYSATQHFERCGSIADPMYHQAGDVVDRTGYDVKGTLLSISRGVSAVAAHILEPLE